MVSSKTSEYYNTTCHVVDPDTVIVQGMRFVKERTCKDITRHGAYGFECSECRWSAYEPNDYGNDVCFDFEYCPNCGCKVVD